MKRVSVNSLQSQPVDEEARVKLRHRGLLQDYLELQKVRYIFLFFFFFKQKFLDLYFCVLFLDWILVYRECEFIVYVNRVKDLAFL